MKRRIISLFLAFSLCASLTALSPVAAAEGTNEEKNVEQQDDTQGGTQGGANDPTDENPEAEEEPTEGAPEVQGGPAAADLDAHTNHPICGANCTDGSNHSGENWTAWNQSEASKAGVADFTKSLPTTAGSYYLTHDVEISTTWQPTGTTNLCLNGYSITYTGTNHGSVIEVDVGVTLTLTDCSTAQSYGYWSNGTTYTITTDLGSVPNGTTPDILVGGLITGGTGTYRSNHAEIYGGGVYVNGVSDENKAATFNMYGGNIAANKVSDPSLFCMGGGVCVDTANLDDNRGHDGTATFNMYGGQIVGNRANGGRATGDGWVGGGGVCVRVNARASFNMYGGKIANNDAQFGGGVLAIGQHGSTDECCHGTDAGGIVNIQGGTITGNTSTHNGGGVTVWGGTLTLESGSITKNTAEGDGGGVYLKNCGRDAEFTMTGGSITDNTAKGNGGGVYMYLNENATFSVGGSPNITGNTGGNVYLTRNETITVGTEGLASGASIGVTMATPGTFTDGWSSYNTTNTAFFSDNTGYLVSVDDSGNELKLGNHVHEINGEDETFTPTATLTDDMKGNYVLTADVTLESTWEPKNDVILDLNGYTITYVGEKRGCVIQLNGYVAFTLYDCNSTNTTHYGQWDSGKTVYTIYDSNKGLSGEYDELIGGIITGGRNDVGGGIFMNSYQSNPIFTMYGGNIVGNTASGNSAAAGGGVCVGVGNMYMYGGTITGNASSNRAGGVELRNSTSYLHVSGAASITGNIYTGNGSASNVYVTYPDRTPILVDGPLTTGASIGVGLYEEQYIYGADGDITDSESVPVAGIFTTGWTTQMGDTAAPGDYFTSDNTNYVVRKNGSEAELHQHSWGDWSETAAATCTEAGSKTRTCATCGAEETQSIDPLGHSYTYTANGAVITETCSNGCDHRETATLSAANGTYTGRAVETGTVVYSSGWLGGELSISYQNNVNVGAATASITMDGATASVGFTISPVYNGWDDVYIPPASSGAVKPEEKPADSDPVESEGTAEEPEDGRTAADYTDVDAGQWYYEAVSYVVEQGLMQGYEDRFDPYADVSRAMLTQILYNSEGQPAAVQAAAFPDVAADEWYGAAVAWAAEAGVVTGYDDGTFGPDDNITREQLAAMLWRYAGSPTAQQRTLDFQDADQVSDYALEALLWATENGIILGKGGSTLDPKGLASRAEAAQMVMRFMTAR